MVILCFAGVRIKLVRTFQYLIQAASTALRAAVSFAEIAGPVVDAFGLGDLGGVAVVGGVVLAVAVLFVVAVLGVVDRLASAGPGFPEETVEPIVLVLGVPAADPVFDAELGSVEDSGNSEGEMTVPPGFMVASGSVVGAVVSSPPLQPPSSSAAAVIAAAQPRVATLRRACMPCSHPVGAPRPTTGTTFQDGGNPRNRIGTNVDNREGGPLLRSCTATSDCKMLSAGSAGSRPVANSGDNGPMTRRSRRRPYGEPHRELSSATVLGGPERIDSRVDGSSWQVRPVRGSDKTYRCPGCDQQILPHTSHVVIWSDDHLFGADAAVGDRRHWHTPCWQARDRRRPG